MTRMFEVLLKTSGYQVLYIHELSLVWQSKSVLELQFCVTIYSIPWKIQTFPSNIIITNLKQLDLYQVWVDAFFFFFFLGLSVKLKMLELHLWKWKFKGSPFIMTISKLDMLHFQVCSLNSASISHLGNLYSVTSAYVSKCNTGSCMFRHKHFVFSCHWYLEA